MNKMSNNQYKFIFVTLLVLNFFSSSCIITYDDSKSKLIKQKRKEQIEALIKILIAMGSTITISKIFVKPSQADKQPILKVSKMTTKTYQIKQFMKDVNLKEKFKAGLSSCFIFSYNYDNEQTKQNNINIFLQNLNSSNITISSIDDDILKFFTLINGAFTKNQMKFNHKIFKKYIQDMKKKEEVVKNLIALKNAMILIFNNTDGFNTVDFLEFFNQFLIFINYAIPSTEIVVFNTTNLLNQERKSMQYIEMPLKFFQIILKEILDNTKEKKPQEISTIKKLFSIFNQKIHHLIDFNINELNKYRTLTEQDMISNETGKPNKKIFQFLEKELQNAIEDTTLINNILIKLFKSGTKEINIEIKENFPKEKNKKIQTSFEQWFKFLYILIDENCKLDELKDIAIIKNQIKYFIDCFKNQIFKSVNYDDKQFKLVIADNPDMIEKLYNLINLIYENSKGFHIDIKKNLNDPKFFIHCIQNSQENNFQGASNNPNKNPLLLFSLNKGGNIKMKDDQSNNVQKCFSVMLNGLAVVFDEIKINQ